MSKRNMILMLAGLFSLHVMIINAQTNHAAAIWELTDPDAGGSGFLAATIGYVTAGNMELTGLETNGYTGPESSLRIRITGNEWPANITSKMEDVYIQFTISPNDYSNFHFDSISVRLGIMYIDQIKAEIYYSTRADFTDSTLAEFSTGNTNNYLDRDQLTIYKIPVTGVVEEGETLYVRIYPWMEYATSKTGKYIFVNDMKLIGSIESLEAPASVIWFKEGVEKPVVTGGLLADSPEYGLSLASGDTMAFLPVNPSVDSVLAGTLQSVSGTWEAEPDTVFSQYVEFEVGPKTGGTFHADSLTMNIGSWHRSDFKASVIFSGTEVFTGQSTILADAVDLSENSMDYRKMDMDTNIADNERMYIRIYPFNTSGTTGDSSYIIVNSLSLHGSVLGVTVDPPQVSTGSLSYLSTTHVLCDGTIMNDGGSIVTSRGVVWGPADPPDILSDQFTLNGTGSGSFLSHITGLVPDSAYYIASYATNIAGTSYGDVISFRTLDAIVAPTVSTNQVSDVLAETAVTGGNVTDWGGDTVIIRGVCWNTTGSPTLADPLTVDGNGLGSYISTMYPLSAKTTYYVRAYAVNSADTAYGEQREFITQAASMDITKIVAKDGSGDYTTVQAAFDAVPSLFTGNYTIEIRPGIYEEKLLLPAGKVNVTLVGEHPDSVILVWHDNYNTPDGSGGTVGTSGSYSVAIDADDFTARNITFQNTNTVVQAVALRVRGDRQTYYHCKLRGFQDTYYTWGLGRIYMNQCHIEGAVDYIFGRATVVFDSCDLQVLRYDAPITAASTDENSAFGYVFRNCRIYTGEYGYDGNRISAIYLGRPWQGRPRVVYMYCEEPSNLASAGWRSMNAGLNPFFAEYKCFGPGYKPDLRSTHTDYTGIQLTDEEAASYTIANIFSKQTNPAFGYNWMPDTSRSRETQSIQFDPLSEMNTGQAPFTLNATATSGLDIVYSTSDPSVATVKGNTLTITGAGTTTITASQPGNFYYLPAQDVEQELTVIQSDVEDVAQDRFMIYPNPAENYLAISTPSNQTYRLKVTDIYGRVVHCIPELSGPAHIDISSLKQGIYFIGINGIMQKIVIR